MKTVTIDFDHTLKFETGDPNFDTIKQIQSLKNCKLFIVTSRKFRDLSVVEIHDFLDMHNIKVVDIIHTGGKSKIETLKELNSELHFEDDIWEIKDIEKAIPNIQVINCFNLKKWQEYFQGL